MPSRHLIIRGTIWIAAVPFWALTFLLTNAALPTYLRQANKTGYTEAVFYVTGAGTTGRYGSQPFLEGEVRGLREIYVDSSAPTMPWPDYLKIFPIGTQISIKFNPQMTGMLLGNQSLRVLKHNWSFEKDAAFIQHYLLFFASPSALLAAALYFTNPKKGH